MAFCRRLIATHGDIFSGLGWGTPSLATIKLTRQLLEHSITFGFGTLSSLI
jgi:hypothetical protein